MQIFKLVTILLLCFLCQTTYSQNNTKSQNYIYKEGDYSGIGKWYMDREIAYVMGYQGIGWLERPEREAEESTTKLIKNLDIQPTDVIADIGAGSGYHVFKMAYIAKKGKVYAVDIQQEMLDAITIENKKQQLKNIVLVKGSEKNTSLPENKIDKILMVDVYHEFSFPIEMLVSMKKALKKDGKIYLIEYRGEDDNVPMKRLHKMTEKQAIKEFEASGFKLLKNISNLPWQHCMVFIKS
ncbi:class I SAM-dependent methyltransferase [uncultured Winogradskyella sp.]|uniref:class I SAM-dependent methyltransferase n=1 Tax=uncultured Winogradskyella sp. TaxID=395353 RepID=UPI002303109F|nr:class I SAM-dependent methyltransferase [Winogradskyella sp.]MDA8874471.1 methyltransferase domain-containing protein [Winogradskyella sp.]